MDTISKIRAEIERLEGIDYPCDTFDESVGFYNALDRIKSFLDTLEEQECPEYCVRSHCIGCSKYNPDEWSNKPRKAKIKATGEIVEGFTDGQGHFDVFTDHNICTRYDVNAVEFDTLEEPKEKFNLDRLREIAEPPRKEDVEKAEKRREERKKQKEEPVCEELNKAAGKRLRGVCNLAEETKEDRPLEERLQELKEIREKKDLDKAAYKKVREMFGNDMVDYGGHSLVDASIAAKLFIAGAQWGAEHFRDTTKMMETPNDLEEAADKFAVSYDQGTCDGIAQECFIAGAKWQKEQMMEEWLKDRDGCFWDGVNEGKKAMREQMMKETVKWLVDDDYDPQTDKGKFILGSVGLGYNGYYIPYSDLLKLPKDDEK